MFLRFGTEHVVGRRLFSALCGLPPRLKAQPPDQDSYRMMEPLIELLREKLKYAEEGGGTHARELHTSRGKMIPRMRIEVLKRLLVVRVTHIFPLLAINRTIVVLLPLQM